MYTNSTPHVNIVNIKNHIPQCQKVKCGESDNRQFSFFLFTLTFQGCFFSASFLKKMYASLKKFYFCDGWYKFKKRVNVKAFNKTEILSICRSVLLIQKQKGKRIKNHECRQGMTFSPNTQI